MRIGVARLGARAMGTTALVLALGAGTALAVDGFVGGGTYNGGWARCRPDGGARWHARRVGPAPHRALEVAGMNDEARRRRRARDDARRLCRRSDEALERARALARRGDALRRRLEACSASLDPSPAAARRDGPAA